ncbi:MAG: lipoyl(octanoyl) transferase LipB [Gammaproteobacteria bacterium]
MKIITKNFPKRPYDEVWQEMRNFTVKRDVNTPDEIWFLEHPPVFTQGQAGKPEHILCPGDIPVVQTDRGGQVTYHGPGQLMVYVLVDLRRRGLGVRDFVSILENSVIQTLAEYGLTAANRPDAPGVYVDGAKICSIGLKISRGCSYHGIAFNVVNNLEPFSRINPCGFKQLRMCKVADFIPTINIDDVKNKLALALEREFQHANLA